MSTIKLTHGEGSRISNKILKALKENGAFIKFDKCKYNNINTTNMFEIKQKVEDELQFVRNEIIKLIPDLFPVNYSFFFVDHFSINKPFNYKLEFSVHTDEGIIYCYTKINEQKPNSKQIESYGIIVD